jgi:hypothetical protein
MTSIVQLVKSSTKLDRFLRVNHPLLFMLELEDINEYRFYKLKPIWRERCECGGMLWLHMIDSSVNQICRHVGCFKQYEISRRCNVCNSTYDFLDVTCDKCEPTVINLATWKTTIEECLKAIKKVNRAFKIGKLTESEWKEAIRYNQEEKERCQKSLEEYGL